MNSSTKILVLGISAFLAFSIGLNLGLMGFFHQPPALVILPAPEIEVAGATEAGRLDPIIDAIEQTKQKPIDQVKQEDVGVSHVPIATLRPTSAPSPPPPKSAGPMGRFVESGGRFPIALLTCNRVELLDQSIRSLLQVKGILAQDIVVFQDGDHKGIAEVVKKYNLRLVQNIQKNNLRGMADGAARIATHYRFSLSRAFDLSPQAPGVIIVEDDLLYSPDFYQYFLSVSPVLDDDPSLFLISAWNDNGFKGLVADPFELRRTDYFPGLGWLLPRQGAAALPPSPSPLLSSASGNSSKRSWSRSGPPLIGTIGSGL
jgi:hypothetical protein